jgi:hypothetical protein
MRALRTQAFRQLILYAEVSRPDARLLCERRARPLQHHFALIEDIGVVGDLQGRLHILFDDEDRDAVVANLLDDLEELRGDDGRKAEARLIQHEKARA